MENIEEPFLCLEADGSSTIDSLSKRFDELFPGKIIRLIIKGDYSPFFYLGDNMWTFKPKYQVNKKTNVAFEMKVYDDDNILNFLEDQQIDLLENLGLNLENFKFITNIQLLGESKPGIMFSDGKHLILDRNLFGDTDELVSFFVNSFETRIISDTTDEKGIGLIVLDINNIFGVIK